MSNRYATLAVSATVAALLAAALSTNVLAQKSVFDQTVVEKENWEPAIPRPEQEKIADAKLKELEQKLGKKPNILIFLVDDMDWGDPGVYGGGVATALPPQTSISSHWRDCD
jgi:arylsulfatase